MRRVRVLGSSALAKRCAFFVYTPTATLVIENNFRPAKAKPR